MSIASSRFYIATAYDGTLELWNPRRDIRTVHTVPHLKIVKVQCGYHGGIALTDQGKVIFFDHCDRVEYQTNEIITDISSGERDLVMTTKSGGFIKMGKRGHYLKTAPPPLSVSIGPAKIAFISAGKLWVGEQEIPHPRPIEQVAVGGGHTVFCDDTGALYGFGHNKRGQLGRGIIEFARDPVRLPFWTRIRKLVSGHEHTVILDVNNQAWITGSGMRGQLGPDIQLIDGCRFGFTQLRSGIIDVYARNDLTMLLFANGDIEQLGERS